MSPTMTEALKTENVRNLTTHYDTPILALLDGKTVVNIVAEGDLPGHSPVCKYIDERGLFGWESEGRFTVIDPMLRPNTALREIARSFGGDGSLR